MARPFNDKKKNIILELQKPPKTRSKKVMERNDKFNLLQQEIHDDMMALTSEDLSPLDRMCGIKDKEESLQVDFQDKLAIEKDLKRPLQEKLRLAGVDVIDEYLKCINELTNPVTKMKAWATLLPYIAPTLKAVEVSGEVSGGTVNILNHIVYEDTKNNE